MLPSAHDIVVKPKVPVARGCHVRRRILHCIIGVSCMHVTMTWGKVVAKGGIALGWILPAAKSLGCKSR
jgi:hypothetical protein